MAAPYLRVTWTDSETGIEGFCVVDRLVGQIATGGTRMRAGCTIDEVADLAKGMSAKCGVFNLPVGGAKGGIDCDPHDPRARGVLTRFVEAMQPLLDGYWTTAEDLGVPQQLLDEIFDEAGMGTSLHAALTRSPDRASTLTRVRSAFATESDGVPMPDLIGGFGVAEAAVTALQNIGITPSEGSAVVQGFGSMGGSTARYLAQHGVRVVGVVDRHGLIVNDHGVDVERLLRARNAYGEIDRTALGPHDRQLPVSEWLSVPADVLVPAATSYAITSGNAPDVRAKLVVEAANVPTTADAEAHLNGRRIPVIPDFVANTGAAAWAWWVLFGDVSTDPQEAFDMLREQMGQVVTEVLDGAARDQRTPRQVALDISDARHAALQRAYAEGRPLKTIA